jgi:hypothetical protein
VVKTVVDLIAEAVAAGRVRRFPPSIPKARTGDPVRIHPEQCGCGGNKHRSRFLDELDGDSE